MATLVLGAVGATLGGLAGGPAGATLGFNIGALVGGLLFPGQRQQIGKLNDLHVLGSSYGQLIPHIWGETRIGGTLIWATDFVQHSSTLKGGGPVQYSYTASFAVSVAQGEIYGIKYIWADDLLIYDATNLAHPTRYTIRIYTGSETQTPDTLIQGHEGVSNTPAYRGQSYIILEDFPLLNWGNRIPTISVETLQDPFTTTTIADVCNQISVECGLDLDDDVDFSLLDDTISGYKTIQRIDGYSIIEELLTIYACDLTEIDGKIVGIKRGINEVLAISAEDLGAREWSSGESDPPVLIKSTRKSDLSLPFRYDIGYLSIDRFFNTTSQGDIRHSRQQVQDAKTISTNISLGDTFARRVASRLLDTDWLERTTHSIVVGWKYMQLAPATPFAITYRGKTYRVRCVQEDIAPFSTLSFECVQDGAGGRDIARGYMNQVVTAPFVRSQTNNIIDGGAPSLFDVYSGIELDDRDIGTYGFYVAMTGFAGWTGGTIYYSTNGTDWTRATFSGQRSRFGTTDNALATWVTPLTVDSTNISSISLVKAETLSSVTAQDILANVNRALVGVEQLSFQDVAPGSGFTGVSYDLTTLTRGERSTVMSGHASSERFWVIDESIIRVNVDASLVSTSVEVRVVSSSQTISDVTGINVTIA